MKKKILYISTNDGSDMRINKEIKSLGSFAEIIYLGIGKESDRNFAKPLCSEFILIEAKRNSLKAVLGQIFQYLKIILKYRIDSVHVINEQLMIFFYPFLFFKHTVLDVFDSIFLMINKPKNQWSFFKRLVYLPINKVIVTDQNRVDLMPDFLKPKLLILENYPNRLRIIKKAQDHRPLTIFYNGSMDVTRGTKILKELKDHFSQTHIIMAGWLTDEITKTFAKSEEVDFRGVLTQNEALSVAAKEADYIMCCYEPSNQNNINASPNKIYDAIQTETPVIINREVKVSQFVVENNVGFVMESFYPKSILELYKNLLDKRDQFIFSKELKEKYTWESVEVKLVEAHNLIEKNNKLNVG